jgi:hypothetical protein
MGLGRWRRDLAGDCPERRGPLHGLASARLRAVWAFARLLLGGAGRGDFVNARDAQVIELVCEACGYRHCSEGVLMCKDARKAGICTREEFELRHVEAERRKLRAAA